MVGATCFPLSCSVLPWALPTLWLKFRNSAVGPATRDNLKQSPYLFVRVENQSFVTSSTGNGVAQRTPNCSAYSICLFIQVLLGDPFLSAAFSWIFTTSARANLRISACESKSGLSKHFVAQGADLRQELTSLRSVFQKLGQCPLSADSNEDLKPAQRTHTGAFDGREIQILGRQSWIFAPGSQGPAWTSWVGTGLSLLCSTPCHWLNPHSRRWSTLACGPRRPGNRERFERCHLCFVFLLKQASVGQQSCWPCSNLCNWYPEQEHPHGLAWSSCFRLSLCLLLLAGAKHGQWLSFLFRAACVTGRRRVRGVVFLFLFLHLTPLSFFWSLGVAGKRQQLVQRHLRASIFHSYLVPGMKAFSNLVHDRFPLPGQDNLCKRTIFPAVMDNLLLLHSWVLVLFKVIAPLAIQQPRTSWPMIFSVTTLDWSKSPCFLGFKASTDTNCFLGQVLLALSLLTASWPPAILALESLSVRATLMALLDPLFPGGKKATVFLLVRLDRDKLKVLLHLFVFFVEAWKGLRGLKWQTYFKQNWTRLGKQTLLSPNNCKNKNCNLAPWPNQGT